MRLTFSRPLTFSPNQTSRDRLTSRRCSRDRCANKHNILQATGFKRLRDTQRAKNGFFYLPSDTSPMPTFAYRCIVPTAVRQVSAPNHIRIYLLTVCLCPGLSCDMFANSVRPQVSLHSHSRQMVQAVVSHLVLLASTHRCTRLYCSIPGSVMKYSDPPCRQQSHRVLTPPPFTYNPNLKTSLIKFRGVDTKKSSKKPRRHPKPQHCLHGIS